MLLKKLRQPLSIAPANSQGEKSQILWFFSLGGLKLVFQRLWTSIHELSSSPGLLNKVDRFEKKMNGVKGVVHESLFDSSRKMSFQTNTQQWKNQTNNAFTIEVVAMEETWFSLVFFSDMFFDYNFHVLSKPHLYQLLVFWKICKLKTRFQENIKSEGILRVVYVFVWKCFYMKL